MRVFCSLWDTCTPDSQTILARSRPNFGHLVIRHRANLGKVLNISHTPYGSSVYSRNSCCAHVYIRYPTMTAFQYISVGLQSFIMENNYATINFIFSERFDLIFIKHYSTVSNVLLLTLRTFLTLAPVDHLDTLLGSMLRPSPNYGTL